MAARTLLTPVRTLERWRRSGTGPRFVRFGKRVRYHGADLVAFIEKKKREHTTDAAA
jgi:hypothetical protein